MNVHLSRRAVLIAETATLAAAGMSARSTGTGATVAYRADERPAFCSTFKALAAAGVLHRNPLIRRYSPMPCDTSWPPSRERVR